MPSMDKPTLNLNPSVKTLDVGHSRAVCDHTLPIEKDYLFNTYE
jgi:hypothetical protein